jgi:hypothetical protein
MGLYDDAQETRKIGIWDHLHPPEPKPEQTRTPEQEQTQTIVPVIKPERHRGWTR